jgi:hypothetical protein
VSKLGTLTASAAVFAGLTLTAGCYTDPCRTLAPPTAYELSAAASGADIERDIDGVECDLEGGEWQRDYDTASYKSTRTSSKAKPTTTVKKPAATTKAKRP